MKKHIIALTGITLVAMSINPLWARTQAPPSYGRGSLLSGPSEVKVFIDQRASTFKVQPGDTVQDLKAEIAKQKNMDADSIALYQAEKELGDDEVVKELEETESISLKTK